MHFQIRGSSGQPVRAVRHGQPGDPVVIVLHGFKGFKEWGMFPWLAEQIAEAGFQAVRFDFSHNGVEEKDFDRLDLFLLDTYTRHQEDLRALAAALPGPLALVGHSRGGADALLFATHEPRVRSVVTWAAVAETTTLLTPEAERTLRTKGYYPIENRRTRQTMPMARTFFDDAPRHSVEEAARSGAYPLLVVHGEGDESVPPSHAERLLEARPDAERLIVPKAGHTFGAVHPFDGPTPALEAATYATIRFLRRHHRPAT